MNKEEEIRLKIKDIKRILSNDGSVDCISEDLIGTDYDESIYSDELYLQRNIEDKFIYLYDTSDDTTSRLSIEDLRVLIRNISTREINEKFELKELEMFLDSEDDE